MQNTCAIINANFTQFKVSIDRVFSAIQDQSWVSRPRPLSYNPKGVEWPTIVHSMMKWVIEHSTVDSSGNNSKNLTIGNTSRSSSLNQDSLWRSRYKREPPNKAQQQRNLTSLALINYKEAEVIFGACP